MSYYIKKLQSFITSRFTKQVIEQSYTPSIIPQFNIIIDEAIERAENTLNLLSPFEFNGDAKNGAMTEFSLKLLLLQTLAHDKRVIVENEKNISGGRCDIVLWNLEKTCAHIVELKYVRCGYLTRTDWSSRDFYAVRDEKLKSSAEAIHNLKNDHELLNETSMVAGCKTRKTIKSQIDDANEQCRRYINSLPEAVTGSVVFGIAGTILRYDIKCLQVISTQV